MELAQWPRIVIHWPEQTSTQEISTQETSIIYCYSMGAL